jgi:hypothetical protein
VAAVFSMGLYAALSPQQRLRRVRDQAVQARQALDGYEGSFAGARPLMAAMFGAAMKQLALVLGPALLASLPLLFMLAWLHGAFGYAVPQQGVDLRTLPPGYEATLRPGDADEIPHQLPCQMPRGRPRRRRRWRCATGAGESSSSGPSARRSPCCTRSGGGTC